MNVRAYEELLRTAADRMKASREAMEARNPKPTLTMDDATLRDWFAGMALQGFCAREDPWAPEIVASEAYNYADAMLKARK